MSIFGFFYIIYIKNKVWFSFLKHNNINPDKLQNPQKLPGKFALITVKRAMQYKQMSRNDKPKKYA